ncbi:RNA polymerase sigma factor [Muribaculum caecicola]|uniref:Sigma-70 family RNA polymerase sigma factor n=2 Tax=Muribaculum TaxID=1918540 RepID=A0AC61S6Z9_9BACT|nr:sigma-70 family RNA polymerase sigma factor [Muribaculum caecicola]THG54198.1 sigma-70 family RNA polymerase sigma factor [Muribaculum caecicola]
MQTLKKLTDNELVRAYVNGNNQAFDMLLQRYQGKVYSYILHIVKNKDVADDIFQETFVKIIMTLRQGRYTDTGKFAAWLNRIAHNLIIDYYRQEKSENSVSIDNDDVDMLNRRDLCEANIEDLMVDIQIRDDVRRIIDALPLPQREVLVMRYYNDMSFKEIAEATGVSINTALGRMRYAILNMRRIASENNIVLTA